jgi:hypothetical protein
MSTSKQACDIQDQESYITFFLSKPSLLWKFHGYQMKFLSRSQRRSNMLDELFAVIRDLFRFLLTPEKLIWNHSHLEVDRIFSYF